MNLMAPIAAAAVLATASATCSSPPVAPPTDPARVEVNCNEFAVDLYRRLAGEAKGNAFLSPYSVYGALTLVHAGAAGQTKDEMANVLHLRDIAAPIDSLAALQAMLAQNAGSSILHTANRLWIEGRMQLVQSYIDTMKKCGGPDAIKLMDFGDAEAARKEINAWVADNTGDMIPELLAQGIITPQTAAVLTNAVYFKADWTKPFPKDATMDMPFATPDGTIDVPMMMQTEAFLFATHEDVSIVALPYDGGQRMIAILPNLHTTLADVEASISTAQLDAWMDALTMQEIIVTFPKLEMESEFELLDVLSSMGMPSAFSGGADFSMIAAGMPPISNVIHQAKVIVDEKGTEAAAATGVVWTRSLKPAFRADRPFMFLIEDVETGAIVFMGRVMDPS